MSSFSGTRYGDISPRTGHFAVATMLKTSQNQIVLEKFAEHQELPKNKGHEVIWRRPIKFAAATTPLVEGVTPSPQVLRYENVSVIVQQYGSWIPFTDVIADTHEDPNLRVMSELAGEQAALTKERIIWGVLRGGTNVFYSGTATQRSEVEDPLDADDFRRAVRVLKNNGAEMQTKMLRPGTGVATQPINAAFIAFAHTNLENDFRDMTGFIPVQNYPSANMVSEYEIGSVENVRIILTNHLDPFFGAGSTNIAGVLNNGTNVDVYPVVIVGKNSYAVVPLSGGSVQMGVKNPKMASGDVDPLGQRGYVAWKMWFAVTRLNEEWMVRLETAASI
jgi:N4-gp56 family major capsid protein